MEGVNVSTDTAAGPDKEHPVRMKGDAQDPFIADFFGHLDRLQGRDEVRDRGTLIRTAMDPDHFRDE